MITEKELAAYLPYGLKWTLQNLKEFEMGGLRGSTLYTTEGSVLCWKKHDDLPQALFPYLFPLSSLTKEELRAQGFESHIDYLTHENKGVEWTLKAPYKMVEYLISKKYDVFNMIERGDAIAVSETFNPYK